MPPMKHAATNKKNDPNNNLIPDGFDGVYTEILGHRLFSLESKQQSNIDPDIDPNIDIILLHGAVASRRYMVPSAKVLARDYHCNVFVPEMPGHGRSDKPAETLSVAEQARVMAAWLHQKFISANTSNSKKRPLYLLANSYGCQVASKIAADNPDLLDGLILTDATGDPEIDYPGYMYRLWLDGRYEPKGAPWMMWYDVFDMGVGRVFATTSKMLEDKILDRLHLIKTRTLLVRGEYDPLSSAAWMQRLAAGIKGSITREIPGGPHSINSANANELCALVAEFTGFMNTEHDKPDNVQMHVL